LTTHLGETITVQATIKDLDGNLVDPDSQEVKVYDPNGTLQATYTSPTQQSTGVYRQSHTTSTSDTPGLWQFHWKTVKGTHTEREVLKVYVAE